MRGGVHAEVFSTVIKNTRARREFAGDPRSSFLQQFPRELQHSLSLVPVNLLRKSHSGCQASEKGKAALLS